MSKIYLYNNSLKNMSESTLNKLKEDHIDLVVLDESGWIKCSDSLPESCQPVYVYDADADVVMEDYFYPNKVGEDVGEIIQLREDGNHETIEVNTTSNGFYDSSIKNITHWMPLIEIDFPDKPTK